jgi:hypothetical protein
MDVMDRISGGLPLAVEELDAEGPHDVAQLWLLARAYSRLRHKTSPRRNRSLIELLKTHCLRRALTRDPDLFLVFVDPGLPHLRVVYHRDERNLLHIPVTVDLA